MESLHQLIQSLTPAEIKGVRAELKRHLNNTKSLKAFDLLQKVAVFSGAESLLKDIYGKTTSSKKLDLLLSRLEAKVLDYLITSKSINDNPQLDDSVVHLLHVRKQLLQVTYLYSAKPKQPVFIKLLEEIISTASAYEFYRELAGALVFKAGHVGIRIGIEEYRRFTDEYWMYMSCEAATRKANDLYQEFNIKRTHHFSSDIKEQTSYIKGAINELTSLVDQTNSSKVRYYLKYFEFKYYEIIGDHNNAIKSAKERLHLLMGSKAAFTNVRMGITYSDLAVNEIFRGNYPEAIQYANETERYFIPYSYNYWVTAEVKILAFFFSKDYNSVQEIADSYLETPHSDNATFTRSKFIVYKANLNFRQKKYKETLRLLSQPLELSSDKTGWAVSVRMLTIMSLVELERFEEAAQHIDSLRKHIERYSKIEVISPRIHIITNLLRTLARYGFNFHQPQLDPYLQQLRLPANAWKPLTPELIPLEQWVEQKRPTL